MNAVSADPHALPVAASQVSVIVPAHQSDDALMSCLAHLAAADPKPLEVIVVADAGPAGTWNCVEAHGHRLIETPGRENASVKRNLGARAARGTVLLFVDSDVAIASDAIGQVVQALNAHSQWSGVFGSYDDAPGAPNFVAQYKGLLNHFVHQAAREEAFTFWTALGAIRKDVFLKAGGFDPSQRLEDVELGYRLRAAGYRIGVCKGILAKHLKPWTAGSLLRSDFFDRALPWTQLMLQHRFAENDLNLDRASRASVACVFAMLVSLTIVWRWPTVLLPIIALLATMLTVLNHRLYAFFLRRRGAMFALGAIAWHWLYFLYGGAAFLLGALLHVSRGSPQRTLGATS